RARSISQPGGQTDRRLQALETQQGPDEEGHCSGDGRTAAGFWPLLARGFGHTLYVVPGAVCTTARWTCQALIHVRDKLHSAYAPNVPKEQTLATQEAPARIVRRWACRPPRWDAARGRAPARRGGRGGPAGAGPTYGCRQAGAGCPATSAGSPRSAAGRPTPNPGRRHPDGPGALLPFGPAADRDHGRFDVRAADRRLDRAARFAPGVTFSRAARKAIT